MNMKTIILTISIACMTSIGFFPLTSYAEEQDKTKSITDEDINRFTNSIVLIKDLVFLFNPGIILLSL